MRTRQIMNTTALQKNFPTVYRDFFAANHIVASASNSFLWTGEFAGFYGGLTVSQKLPIRSYVGLETTYDGQVTLEREYTTFQAETAQFSPAVIDDRLHDQLQVYLQQELPKRSNFTGVLVHILTELPLGHSLGSNGAVAAALATVLCPSNNFEQRLAKARDILLLSQAGHSSGVSAYMALTEAAAPVVFFSDDAGYCAKTITELAGLTEAPIWPIDFGLIYSGGGANAESVILANNQTINELNVAGKELEQLLGARGDFNFRHTYTQMLNLTSGLFVNALTQLFCTGTKNQLLQRLFNALNQYQNLLHILHVTDGATDLIYSRIHQLASKQVNDVGSGVKISGIGKGGAVLFALPYGVHRQQLTKLLADLRRQTGRNIWLDYASWIDGIGGLPALLEQDLSQGHQASFLNRDAASIRLLKQGQLQQDIVTDERFQNYLKQVDLLVDQTNGKVTIAGKTMTSRELPSQKATVKIIADLLERTKRLLPQDSAALPGASKPLKFVSATLSNNELFGSYGTSRYDLQGKIVMPLIKQVKELTGRDLQLTITGGMYDNYELRLNPSNIVIAVLEKKV